MKIGIFGINGKMGSILAEQIVKDDALTLLWGVDPINTKPYQDIPIYQSLEEVEVPQCIVDFSHHSHIKAILDFALKFKCSLVIATTAHTEAEIALIKEASQTIPIFYSANMSYGIQIVKDILKLVTQQLEDYDIEIEEIHHRDKLDAPSGTAKLLAETINHEVRNKKWITNGHFGKRSNNEITIHALRGGSVVGTHKVLFLGNDEVIEISHSALSKVVFIHGAIKAIKFIGGMRPGLYSMDDLTKRKEEIKDE